MAILMVLLSAAFILTAQEAKAAEKSMSVDRFNRRAATENGYTITALSDGTQVSILSAQHTGNETDDELRWKAGTHGVVGGDCGTSYVDFDPYTGGFDLYTGFTVNLAAISYGWSVRTLGPYNYDEGETWGGNLNFQERWDGIWPDQAISFSGNYSALADGWALLMNGAICTSNNPTDSTYIQA